MKRKLLNVSEQIGRPRKLGSPISEFALQEGISTACNRRRLKDIDPHPYATYRQLRRGFLPSLAKAVNGAWESIYTE
jgi:hypothetical protein